ncbi:hypothetical protein [Streptomyces scopuliridis]|uniref:hypothetical protein n=1 Tax=Streptomyces scopuliridis TaxID=452529 RepID=UPI0036ACEF75
MRDRTRGGVYLALGLATIGMFGLFLFMTYCLQIVRGYSPVLSGLAFLPLVAGMMIGFTQIGARLMLRVPVQVLMSLSLLATAAGIASLTAIGKDSSYAALILPGMTVVGLGLGTAWARPPCSPWRWPPTASRTRTPVSPPPDQHLAAGRRRHRHRTPVDHRRRRHPRLLHRTPRGRPE